MDPTPLLAVVGGGGRVLRLLDVADARKLRATHPRLTAAVARALWTSSTATVDGLPAFMARFAAALPHAQCLLHVRVLPGTDTDMSALLPPSLVRVKLLQAYMTDATIASLPSTPHSWRWTWERASA